MFTVVHQIQGESSRPLIHESDRCLPYRSIEEALRLSAVTHENLKTKYGFKIARLVGVRDLKTGRFVA